MTDKYKVPQAVMDELNEYKDNNEAITITDLLHGISYGSKGLRSRITKPKNNVESRKREQAVIDYVFNGADNFEVKTPKWVLISKRADEDGDWHYLRKYTGVIGEWDQRIGGYKGIALKQATRITDPKLKDALLYANPDFEAIEVEE